MNWQRLQKQALRRHLLRAARNREISQLPVQRITLCLVIAIGALAFLIARFDFRSPTVKRYAAWDQAYLRRDGPAMERILAPEFHLDTWRGNRIARAKYVDDLLKSPPKNGYWTRVWHINAEGAGLTALVDVTLFGSDGEPHRYRYRDQWSQRNGVWVMFERSRSWNEPHQ